ncbi:Nucleic-acid-binding protein, partial [Aphis craccivora]
MRSGAQVRDLCLVTNMSLSPNEKTNIKNKNINDNNKNKNNKTITQDARLNISTNNSNASLSSTQNNTNSPNNDGWIRQAEKRNLSSPSEPSSPTQNTIRHKKLFISRNRYEVLSQNEAIEVDTITPNLDPELSNPEAHTSQVKSANLPPTIIVKGIKDF